MYLYFDKNGTLKEIINTPKRAGDSNAHKIYVYWEGVETETIRSFKARYKLPDGTLYPSATTWDSTYTVATGTQKVIKQDNNRDLYFFEYGKQYDFYIMTIPDDVFETNGKVKLSVYYDYGTNETIAMGLIVFNVDYSTSAS